MAQQDLCERLVQQLDTLVAFLALSRKEVFELIRAEYEEWFPPNERQALPRTFGAYKMQVIHSAFLLGHSYFEAFLADLARAIYRRRPAMLPLDRELKFREVLDAGKYASLLDHMIEKEVTTVFYGSVENIAQHFETRLGLTWPTRDGQPVLVEASLVRNCIVHNGARVNKRLARLEGWTKGTRIALDAPTVHSYGMEARGAAKSLFEQAASKHFGDG